jgi:hypothetical protein
VAKDKISKLLGLNTLQGSKHDASDVDEEEAARTGWQAKVWARDLPWYAQGSCLCDGIPFSFANIVQTLVC